MLAIKLFGGFTIERSGVAVELASRPAQALLAYLALHPGKPHRRERLAGLIWPDTAEEAGRNNLRHALWRIRGALGDDAECIAADRVGIALVPRPGVIVDVAALAALDPARATIDQLTGALGACTGELLAGFYDDWVQLERDRVVAGYERAARALADALVAARRWRDVVTWGERWIAVARTSEPAFRAVMTGHAELGDLAAVEAVYQRLVIGLDDELGVDPSPESQALHRRLTEDPRAVAAVAPAASVVPAARPRYRLPAEVTSFVGRGPELARLGELLAAPGCRLISVVGPGGAGKTRLALRAAGAAAPRFADGACLVELGAVDAADRLPLAVADALGIAVAGGAPVADQVRDHLRERAVLLVLDNFEQLVGDRWIGELIAGAPAVVALVTSRERLAIRAEQLFPIAGVDAVAAAELFVARARQLSPDFALGAGDAAHVDRIAAMLGGLPLGIELAAALAPVEGCAAVAQEVERAAGDLASPWRDQPERHRSLRAVFEHSRRLLDPDDDRLLAVLAVFRGGFTTEAAIAIAGARADRLGTLADKSLVARRDGRWVVHEVLRQLAGERTPADAPDLHARWFCAELGRLAGELVGAGQRDAMAALAAELDNLRAAWRHAVVGGDAAALAAAADGLFVLLDRRSAFVDGEQLFRLAVEREGLPPALAGRLAARLAGFAYQLGDMTRARELAERGLAAAAGDAREQAFARYVIGRVDYRTSRLESAAAQLEQSVDLWRHVGDASSAGAALSALGMVATSRGDYARARALQTEAIGVLEAAGDASGAARAENHLGIVEGAEGNYDRAEQLLRHSLAVWREIGNDASAATALNNLGVVAERRGDLDGARAVQEEGLLLRRQIGDRFGVSYSLSNLGIIARKQGRLDDARRCFDECLELRRRLGDLAGAASTLLNLGRALADAGDTAGAFARWGEALDAALSARARPRVLEVIVEVGCVLAAARPADAAVLLGVAAPAVGLEQVERDRAARVLAELGGGSGLASIDRVAEVLRAALGPDVRDRLAALLA
jgi:DNA-binding SARP family transcriptional activator/predicted ATPase